MKIGACSFIGLIFWLMLAGLRLAQQSTKQSVNVDITIPNEAFKRSFVVNLANDEVVHLEGGEASLFDEGQRRSRKKKVKRQLLKL